MYDVVQNCTVHAETTTLLDDVASSLTNMNTSLRGEITFQFYWTPKSFLLLLIFPFFSYRPSSRSYSPPLSPKGSCGGNHYLHSHGGLTSPNYPLSYLNNLRCVWTIISDTQKQITVNITYLSLESNYDAIRIYEGFCCNQSSLIVELTGQNRSAELSRKISPFPEIVICIATVATHFAYTGYHA